jgi:hypothetical protein
VLAGWPGGPHSVSSSDSVNKLHIEDQAQSPLFQLPTEIRTLIYEAVFEHHVLRIQQWAPSYRFEDPLDALRHRFYTGGFWPTQVRDALSKAGSHEKTTATQLASYTQCRGATYSRLSARRATGYSSTLLSIPVLSFNIVCRNDRAIQYSEAFRLLYSHFRLPNSDTLILFTRTKSAIPLNTFVLFD